MINFNFDVENCTLHDVDEEIEHVENFLNCMDVNTPSDIKLHTDIHCHLNYLYNVRDVVFEREV